MPSSASGPRHVPIPPHVGIDGLFKKSDFPLQQLARIPPFATHSPHWLLGPSRQAQWVEFIDRGVVDIWIEINPSFETNGVLGYEPAGAGIEIARPIEVKPGFRIKLATGVPEGICERSSASSQIPEAAVA